MSEPNEDVLRKIRKLLALSESPNVNEAANAAAKARKLLLEHGLTMEAIGTGPAEIHEDAWRRFDGPRKSVPVAALVNIVAQANMCKVLLARGRTDHDWILVGRPTATAAAKTQLDYLYSAMERDSKAASMGRGAAWMNDYRRGWLLAVKARMDAETKTDSVEERGLVLREDSAVTAYMAKADFANEKTKIRSANDAGAVRHGFRDGSKISLSTQIAGGGA